VPHAPLRIALFLGVIGILFGSFIVRFEIIDRPSRAIPPWAWDLGEWFIAAGASLASAALVIHRRGPRDRTLVPRLPAIHVVIGALGQILYLPCTNSHFCRCGHLSHGDRLVPLALDSAASALICASLVGVLLCGRGVLAYACCTLVANVIAFASVAMGVFPGILFAGGIWFIGAIAALRPRYA